MFQKYYPFLLPSDLIQQCLKFKTYSSIFLNRFETLNLSLMQKMQNRRPREPVAATPEKKTQAETTHDNSKPVAITVVPATSGAPQSGGVKKKKPKKKKWWLKGIDRIGLYACLCLDMEFGLGWRLVCHYGWIDEFVTTGVSFPATII
jgi:hypothetical protein